LAGLAVQYSPLLIISTKLWQSRFNGRSRENLSKCKGKTKPETPTVPCPCLILGLPRRVQYGFSSAGQAAHPNFVEGQGTSNLLSPSKVFDREASVASLFEKYFQIDNILLDKSPHIDYIRR